MSLIAAASITVGIHIGSAHIPQKDQSNVNPGIYLRHENWQVGYYRNSHKRDTFYAGYAYPVGPVDLTLGIATGYKEKCQTTKEKVNGKWVTTEDCRGFSRHSVTPLAAITYSPPIEFGGVKPRIWFAPSFGKTSTVLHLSLERSF